MLTAQQLKLLEFLEKRIAEKGVSPSFDEMKDALGLKSKSGVHRLIKALEERGFIRRLANRARAIEVIRSAHERPEAGLAAGSGTVIQGPFAASTPPSRVSTEAPAAANLVDIPLHGRIAAGTPIEALEHAGSSIAVPEGLTGRGVCYALEVSGDSMIEKGILDGDTVIIERCQTARDGEVVVALVDREEATLKTLKRAGAHIALVPANRDHETQIYDPAQVQVQGRLVGLLRTYH